MTYILRVVPSHHHVASVHRSTDVGFLAAALSKSHYAQIPDTHTAPHTCQWWDYRLLCPPGSNPYAPCGSPWPGARPRPYLWVRLLVPPRLLLIVFKNPQHAVLKHYTLCGGSGEGGELSIFRRHSVQAEGSTHRKVPLWIEECEVPVHRKNGWIPVPGSTTGVFIPRQCLVDGRYAVRLSHITQYVFNPLHS